MKNLTLLQRRAWVRAGRMLNTSVDRVFYDVGSLTSEDNRKLSIRANPEGSIVIVPPKTSLDEIKNLSPLEFIKSQTKPKPEVIDAIVVAGVGSSARGTAALARNVANYLGRPVAGIVSGMGLADVISEALGGWFVFGTRNSIRDGIAKLFDVLDMKDHVWDETSYRSLVKDKAIARFDMNSFIFGSPDSVALFLILYHLRSRIKLLIGHSKGNYVIENALEGLVDLCKVKKQKVPTDLKVVTLGAVVRFPDEFKSNVHQFIGELDGLGILNSRPKIPCHRMPSTWHSLNTRLYGHMPVEEVLELAGVS